MINYIGKSGCGKTTLILNLLSRDGWLDYSNLQVFDKSLFQPEYIRKAFAKNLPKKDTVQLFRMREQILRNKGDPTAVLEEIGKGLPPVSPPSEDGSLESDVITCEVYMFTCSMSL